MKRSLAPALLSIAALALAGCGSDDNGTASPASSATSATAGTATAGSGASATTATVHVVKNDKLGTVLADANGDLLYASDQEAADPHVVCTDACEQFWMPVAAGSGAPTGGPGATDLGVTERPDGVRQVTYEGRRLYTFANDKPGEAKGDGVSDNFSGQHFTWHVVVVDAAGAGGAASTPTTASGDSGY
jgi:predicted lipoprotein with Yx(FWY)xxD motif